MGGLRRPFSICHLIRKHFHFLSFYYNVAIGWDPWVFWRARTGTCGCARARTCVRTGTTALVHTDARRLPRAHAGARGRMRAGTGAGTHESTRARWRAHAGTRVGGHTRPWAHVRTGARRRSRPHVRREEERRPWDPSTVPPFWS